MDPSPDYDASDEIEYFFSGLLPEVALPELREGRFGMFAEISYQRDWRPLPASGAP